jgi:penicillin amidase
VPNFSIVYGDVDGRIGYQAAGRIPIRDVYERGYRPGWDPRHQWQGLVPFDGMPQVIDPPRGWVATANNRPAPDDFPYPLAGTWSEGMRHARIREMFDAKSKYTQDDYVAMQQDSVSLRARRGVPHLLPIIEKGLRKEIVATLAAWDFRMEPDSIAATIWEFFFAHWMKVVVDARFEGEVARLLPGGVAGLAAALLEHDSIGWFPQGEREKGIVRAFMKGLDAISKRLDQKTGDFEDWNYRIEGWQWGRIHTLPLRHYLSGRGDLAQLLDHGGIPVKGNAHTVCNTGIGHHYEARSGPGYRLIADLTKPGLHAVDGQSQSGHPGSPHYRDQLDDWISGRYHYIALDAAEASKAAVVQRLLEPI